MVGVCQMASLGSRREGRIIGRKSPIFVDFRLPDQENFRQGCHYAHENEYASPSVPMDSFRDRWSPLHGGKMHGRSKIHDRLPGIAKER